jgi:hypothetical protein
VKEAFMAEVKGKFITMAWNLMHTLPEAQKTAQTNVERLAGKSPTQLEPESWYDAAVLQSVFDAVREHESEVGAWTRLRVMGIDVYPTIKQTVGLPDHLTSPLDFVTYEAEGFLADHRGPDVIPRKIVTSEPGHVVIDAPSPGYDCVFIEGVFDGILRMVGIYGGKVKQTKCIRNGGSTCEYDIQW